MANFQNSPNFVDGKIRRFVHQKLTVEHHGINLSIQENGQVVLSKVVGPDPDNKGEVLVDEIKVPASLIFKAANLLRATRQVTYITLAEAAKLGVKQENEVTEE